jgi:hypothetical protein
VALHSDTEIYAAVVELAKFVTRVVQDLRRDMKPTIGKMLLEECVWMGVVVRRINIARDQAKLPLLEELLEQLEIVQFVLRLARDCHYIAIATFADSVPLTASVGKQATALRNHFAPAP